jgi:hypothetical protein
MATSGNFVENKIRGNIIPATKTWGIVIAILGAIGIAFSGEIIAAICYLAVTIASIFALIILLDGYAEIIALLRNISIQMSSLNLKEAAPSIQRSPTWTDAKTPAESIPLGRSESPSTMIPLAAPLPKGRYTCQTHPKIISFDENQATDRNGLCPICGTKLVPMA